VALHKCSRWPAITMREAMDSMYDRDRRYSRGN
jgi:hypothetical protein